VTAKAFAEGIIVGHLPEVWIDISRGMVGDSPFLKDFDVAFSTLLRIREFLGNRRKVFEGCATGQTQNKDLRKEASIPKSIAFQLRFSAAPFREHRQPYQFHLPRLSAAA
jgi:hypothetical protein